MVVMTFSVADSAAAWAETWRLLRSVTRVLDDTQCMMLPKAINVMARNISVNIKA